MLSASHIRIHGREQQSRRNNVESALLNAGALTLTVLMLAIVVFGVLVIRAS